MKAFHFFHTPAATSVLSRKNMLFTSGAHPGGLVQWSRQEYALHIWCASWRISAMESTSFRGVRYSHSTLAAEGSTRCSSRRSLRGVVVEPRVKSIGCYSNSLEILLVGEGDFSFVLALANAFGYAANIVATSLDSCADIQLKYEWSTLMLWKLIQFGAKVLYNIDCTTMASNPAINKFRFDVIVWNLPHAGFFGRPEGDESVIRIHQALLKSIFWNASKLLKPGGEVHVTHQARGPYQKWNLCQLAISTGLFPWKSVPFDMRTFPGYKNRKGSGIKAKETFYMDKVRTNKFIICKVLHERVEPKTGGDDFECRRRKYVLATSVPNSTRRKENKEVNHATKCEAAMAHWNSKLSPNAPTFIPAKTNSYFSFTTLMAADDFSPAPTVSNADTLRPSVHRRSRETAPVQTGWIYRLFEFMKEFILRYLERSMS